MIKIGQNEKEEGNFGTDSRFFKPRERIYECNQIELHQNEMLQ